MSSSFAALDLRPELLEALGQMGYVDPTPIQAEALPHLMAGLDLIGRAMTGSGKTAAFGLALLHRIQPDRAVTQALVLCPTRELADQVAAELRRLGQRMKNLRVLSCCGGRPSYDQKKGLQRGAHVVVGTPGRVGKHLRKGDLDPRGLVTLVLDEADRMLDMGFIEEVEDIVLQCPPKRQTLLFSATFPEAIGALSGRVQTDPYLVVVQSQVEPEKLRQIAFKCQRGERNQLLANLLVAYRPERTLVFCETRSDCDKLAAFLSGRGATALALHGQLEQRERDDVLVQFGNGSASVLVATNVAARGLDIPALPAVIIAELSPDPESHLHRVGRTGRAGQEGLALSIVASPKELERLERIEAYMGEKLERAPSPTESGGLEFLTPPNRTLLILAGRKDKLRKADVLGALVKDGGIPADAIGRIDLMQRSCAVAITHDFAQQALRYVQGGRIKKSRVRAQLLGGRRG